VRPSIAVNCLDLSLFCRRALGIWIGHIQRIQDNNLLACNFFSDIEQSEAFSSISPIKLLIIDLNLGRKLTLFLIWRERASQSRIRRQIIDENLQLMKLSFIRKAWTNWRDRLEERRLEELVMFPFTSESYETYCFDVGTGRIWTKQLESRWTRPQQMGNEIKGRRVTFRLAWKLLLTS
jgi:hypothetical protein